MVTFVEKNVRPSMEKTFIHMYVKNVQLTALIVQKTIKNALTVLQGTDFRKTVHAIKLTQTVVRNNILTQLQNNAKTVT